MVFVVLCPGTPEGSTGSGSGFFFVAVFLGCTSTGRVGLCFFVVLCPGTPEGSTGSGSGFKASQKTGQRFKVSSDRLSGSGFKASH